MLLLYHYLEFWIYVNFKMTLLLWLAFLTEMLWVISCFSKVWSVDWYCWSKYWPCLYLIVALHRMKVTNYLNRFECKYWEGCFSRKVTIFSNRTLMNIILDLPPHQDEIKPSPYTGPLYYVLPLIIIVISSYLDWPSEWRQYNIYSR